MRKSNLILAWTLFALISPRGQAQEVANEPPQAVPPVISREVGKPITLTWPDGRVAVIKAYHATLPEIKISFQVFENLCRDSQGQNCQHHLYVKTVWLFPTWSVHPDPSKIGQALKRKSDPEGIVDTDFAVFSDSKQLYPVLGKDLPNSKISCENYDWIPGGTKQTPPDTLLVSRWGNEFMFSNPETNISENRTIGGATNVRFTRNRESALTFERFHSIDMGGGIFVETLIFGNNLSWTTTDETGQACQIALKPGSLDMAQRVFEESQRQRPKPEDVETVYIYGADELTYNSNDSGSFQSELKFWESQLMGNDVE